MIDPQRITHSRPPFFHLTLLALILFSATGQGATQETRWNQMDYGPFLASSVTLPWAKDPENLDGIVLKGLTFKFGELGAACFDTGELRWAGVWTGGWLGLHGTPFDGTHRPPERSRPVGQGTPIYGTSHGPGWAKGTDWRDPRPEIYVPFPSDWAKYRGLSFQGAETRLRYTVGETEVTEVPWLETRGETTAFVRRIHVGAHRKPMRLLAAELRLELRNKVGFTGAQASDDQRVASLGDLSALLRTAPAGARWEVDQAMRLVLSLPAGGPMEFDLLVARSKPEPMRRFLEPGAVITRPEVPRPVPSVTTQGRLGTSGDAYEVDTLTAPETNPHRSWLRFGGFDFFEGGKKAALCTWSGDVWTVDGIDDSLERLEWRRYASGLFQPLGLKIVRGQVYVLGRDQITRLIDRDGDGMAEHYECFNNDVSITPNFHEFALDLHTDPKGNFYFNKGAPLLGTEYWDPTSAHNGCTLKVSADGRTLERFATGLRAPNGLGVGPRGEVTSADNEGIWTPVCRLNWVKAGGFYGSVGMDHGAIARRAVPGWDEDDFPPRYPDPRYDPPLCWLPFAVDNSAGSQVWAEGKGFGPLQGSLLHLSYGKCRAFKVLRQEVEGIMQGGVVPLPWKFESSAARGRMNPKDGSLYVCGLKGWQTTAARDGAFHRVRYTPGKPFPTLEGFRVEHDALVLQFNAPLDSSAVADTGNWSVQWWNYRWSKSYGSDLYSPNDPKKQVGKKGELKGENLPIHRATLDSDGRTVRLNVAQVQPVMQLMVRASLKWADGKELPVEYYGTINRVPKR